MSHAAAPVALTIASLEGSMRVEQLRRAVRVFRVDPGLVVR